MLFQRSRFLGVRAFILLSCAAAMMVLEHKHDFHSWLRQPLQILLTPLEYVVDAPVAAIHWVGDQFSTAHQLRERNAQLQTEHLVLQARLQRLEALERENEQLHDLLSARSVVSGSVLVAKLLSVDMAPFSQQVVVNKGEKDDVYVGQPVLDAHGVMGQVVEVGPTSSRILLITDTRSAVPVQNNRNGARSIAAGQGYSGELDLRFIPDTSDFQPGDVLVTSGLGQRYPIGYPVGEITSVEHEAGARFLKITVKPKAQLNKSREVLLVWPTRQHYANTRKTS